jgi:cytochrome P450
LIFAKRRPFTAAEFERRRRVAAGDHSLWVATPRALFSPSSNGRMFGLLMELVLRLDALPVLRERLVAELDAAEVGTDASPEQLYALTAMNDVVREAKRAAPILPLVFGTAARDFELGGYTIPQALGVWMALSLSNRDIRHFAEPERFDPDR